MFCPDDDCGIAVKLVGSLLFNCYMHSLHVETGWSIRTVIHYPFILPIILNFNGRIWPERPLHRAPLHRD